MGYDKVKCKNRCSQYVSKFFKNGTIEEQQCLQIKFLKRRLALY